MSRTVCTEVYQYAELTAQAKARALDWYQRAWEGDTSWADITIEEAARFGALLGIEIDQRPYQTMGGQTRYEPAVYWELHVQGAGACFEGRYQYRKGGLRALRAEVPRGEGEGFEGNNRLLDAAEALQAIQKAHGYRLHATVTQRGTSSHEHATEITVYLGEEYADEGIAEAVREGLRAFMRWIYYQLDAEYLYQFSEEQIVETIKANEYEFYADGTRARGEG